MGAALLGVAAPAAAQPLPPPPAPPSAPEPIVIHAPTGIPAGARASATPLSMVYLLSREPGGAAAAWRVSFREEATQAEYVTRNGGASATGAVLVDCDGRTFQLERFSLYRRNNLEGEERIHLDRRTRWQTPGRDTLLWRVVELACGPGAPAPSVPRAAVASRTSAEPAPAPARAAAAPTSGGYWVQVGASDSADLARGLLERLAGQAPELGATGRQVVGATVRSRKVYRSLFGPYAERAAAVDACARLSSRRQPCFVRAGD